MKTLILLIHLQIFKFRRGIILILIALSLSAAFAKKTTWNYGFEAKINSANQLAFNPRNIQNETFHWKQLSCVGLNTSIEFEATRTLYLQGKLGYQQKGFIQSGNTFLHYKNGNKIEAPYTQINEHKNKFHYLTVDAVTKFKLSRKKITPIVTTGIRFNYLLAKNSGSAADFNTIGTQFYDYQHYKKAALSALLGVGASINNKITVFYEMDYDLTKSVSTNNLIVRNWVNSIALSINLNELFHID